MKRTLLLFVVLGCVLGLPCHSCHEGQVVLGLNYSLGALGAPSCLLPETVNCTEECTVSSGAIQFNSTTINFDKVKSCDHPCLLQEKLARSYASSLPNTTVVTSTCDILVSCSTPFCNWSSVPDPLVLVLFVGVIGLI